MNSIEDLERIVALLASIAALIGTVLQEIRDWLRKRSESE